MRSPGNRSRYDIPVLPRRVSRIIQTGAPSCGLQRRPPVLSEHPAMGTTNARLIVNRAENESSADGCRAPSALTVPSWSNISWISNAVKPAADKKRMVFFRGWLGGRRPVRPQSPRLAKRPRPDQPAGEFPILLASAPGLIRVETALPFPAAFPNLGRGAVEWGT